MKFYKRIVSRQRQGVIVALVPALLAAMLVFAFMAINLAHIQSQHADSQIASDLGARWGVDVASRSSDSSEIRAAAREMVELNLSDKTIGKDIEIQVGSAVPGSSGLSFSANQRPYNAVRAVAKSDLNMVGFVSLGSSAEMGIERQSTAVAVERDICLVVDRSGSMTFDLDTANWIYDNSYHPENPLTTSSNSYHRRIAYSWWHVRPHPTRSRWSTMIPAVYGLADELDKTAQKERLSIVSYSTSVNQNAYGYDRRVYRFRNNTSEIEAQPTEDYDEAVRTLEYKYKYNQLVSGGTNIYSGIQLATQVLGSSTARPNAFKTMIVMTDGQYNSGGDPTPAAVQAAAQDIEVYTVTFSRQADQSSMRRVASAGNGRHFHAPDGDALEEIFREIANIPRAAFIK